MTYGTLTTLKNLFNLRKLFKKQRLGSFRSKTQHHRRTTLRRALGTNLEQLEGRAMMAVNILTSLDTAFQENFDSMGTSATATIPSQIRVNQATDYTSGTTATTLAAGTSGTGALTGTSSGGTYNFATGVTASSTDRALGFLTTGTFTSPRNIIAAVTNNTGSTVASLDISFDYEKYRAGTRAWNMNFFHGSTATPITAATLGDQTYAADGANAVVNPATTISKSFTLSGLSIPNGSTYYLRWASTGNGGSTNGQGIGIDNLSVTARAHQRSSITGATTTATFSATVGSPSASQTFPVSGTFLTDSITAMAPTGFEVSSDGGTNWGNAATFSQTSGNASGNLSVRLKSTATAGLYNGVSISLASTGASTVNITTPSAGNYVSAQTLTAGDVAIIGDISNGSPDSFMILALTDLTAGTTFIIGDNEVTTDGGTSFADLAEGAVYFSVNTNQTIAKGTVISLPWGGGPVTTATYSFGDTTGFGLSNPNDEIYIYTAPSTSSLTPTAFIFGANTATSSAGKVPAGLTTNSTFINITGTNAGNRYKTSGATYNGSKTQLLSAIGSTTTNWEAVAPANTSDWTFSVQPGIDFATTSATAFSTTYGTASAVQTFSVSGSNLTANIISTAPTGFEVSSDGTSYGSTATFTQTAGSASGALRVRLAANAAVNGTYNSQNIVLSSTGATSVNIVTAASGNTVATKGLTITGLTAQDKNFDGATTATATGTPAYSGLVNGETPSVSTSGTLVWAFADATVGTGKSVTLTSGSFTAPSTNYTITQPTLTASINAVAASAPTINSITPGDGTLSVSFTPPTFDGGATITNYKYSTDGGSNFTAVAPAAATSPILITSLTNGTIYNVQIRAVNSAGDGTASATTQGTPAAPVSPTISVTPSTLAAALTTIYGTASSAQTFTVSGANLTGNLTVTAPTGLEVSSDGINYDTTATVIASGTLGNTTISVRLKATAAAPGNYNGATIAVTGGGASEQDVLTTASGNTVEQKALTITGLTATAKEYDRTTSASATGTATYSGLENNESFSVQGTPTYTFTSANVGTAVGVTVSGFTAPSGNYTVTQPSLSANITAKALTVTGATPTSRAYDGTTAVVITGASLVGVISPDTVTVSGGGTIADANAGTAKVVTAALTLGGTDMANYTITQPSGLTVDITKASQTITFGALPAKTDVSAPFTLSATASSSLPVTYASSNNAVATVSGNTVTIVGAGSTMITASQAGDSNYNAATDATQNLVVTTTLAAGDLAIIDVGPSGTDDLAAVFLKGVVAGTVVNFTDNGFASATTGRTGEGFLTYTAPSDLPAGTVITWNGQTTGGWRAISGSFALNASGEQLFAFTGPTANWATQSGIVLLDGFNTGNSGWITTGTAVAGTSYQPDISLIAATYLNQFSNANVQLTATTLSDTKANILAYVADPANYTTSTADLTLPSYTNFTVKQAQTITFGALSPATYGDAQITLSATASSGLAVAYASSDPNVATISGNTLTIVGAGISTITASQAGDNTYGAATPIQQTLTVSAKGISVSADPKPKTYGDSDPILTYSADPLVGSDQFTGSLSRAAGENVGTYAISQGSLSAGSNYSISFTGANLTVNQKALTITANNVSKTFGQTLTGGAGSTAFMNTALAFSETVGSVTITYGSGASSGDPVGTYTGSVVGSAATGGTFNPSNYSITYVAGNIIVSADATITTTGSLSAVNTTYGTASTTPTSFDVSGVFLTGDLTVTAPSGFQVSTTSNSGYNTSLTLTQSSGTVANTTIYVRLAATTAAGTYSGNVTITGGGATQANVATASSTVAQKALTITGLTATGKQYDAGTSATVTGTPVYSGLANGETFPALTVGTWTYADKSKGTGKPLSRSVSYAAPSTNYTVTQPSLSADITAAPLTVTGATVTPKPYDGTNAATITGATLSGVLLTDVVTIATSTGTFADVNVGTGIAVTAALTLSGADVGNYSFTQPTGLTGNITQASQTITFGPLANQTTATSTFNLTATASSGLTVSYTSSNTSVATVSGNTVTILTAGTTTITASQAGNNNYVAATDVPQSLTITTAADTTPPTVTALSPADNATNVVPTVNLVMTFSENVVKNVAGTQRFKILRVADDSALYDVPVSDSSITISGATVTINPPTTLFSNDAYYVTIGAGAFTDVALNSYAGITSPLTWNFTTGVDSQPPSVSSLSPADDSTNVALNSNLVVNFNENVLKGTTGNIEVRKVADNSLVESISVTNSAVTVNGASVTIDPSSDFASSTALYVIIPAGAFKDTSLTPNNFAGINSTTAWNFTTIAALANPTVSITSGNVVYSNTVYSATASIMGFNAPEPSLSFTYYSDAGGTTTIAAPTNAGTYFVRAFSAANSSNNAAQSAITQFIIDMAPTTTTVTIAAGTFTYNGLAQTPATVTVTGAGGLNLTPTASYSNNTNAGTATASYSFAGDSNYLSSTDSKNFTIDKATTTINTAPTASAITVGQTLASSNLTGGSASVAGGFAFTTPSFVPPSGTSSQSVTFTPTDSANYNSATTSVNVTANVSNPTLTSVAINGGLATPFPVYVVGTGASRYDTTNQKSEIVTLVVNFSEPVSLGSAPFKITNTDTATDLLTSQVIYTPINLSGGFASSFLIRFGAGTSVISRNDLNNSSAVTVRSNSLADGNYNLTIDPNKVTSQSTGKLTGDNVFGDNYSVDQFFRLFGDGNGDGIVNSLDNGAYARASGAGGYTYNAAMDWNGDGIIGTTVGSERDFYLSNYNKRRR